MANPFLDFDDGGAEDTDSTVNPFLLQDGDDEGNGFSATATNPFAFGDEPEEITANAPFAVGDIFNVNQPEAHVEDAAMSFFGTTIQDEDTLSVESKTSLPSQLEEASHEHEHKTGPPPRPAAPPSLATQDLISEVAGHLDQASTQMLDRIPVTRTPSPVSMRDLHSPSPTPDNMGDLVDVSDNLMDNNNLMGDDLLFEAATVVSSNQGAAVVHPVGKAQPPRPPPPRPAAPPRPIAPPAVAGIVQATPATVSGGAPHEKQEGDLFDMFGTTPPPKPPPPKTKEDILSLYSQKETSHVEKADLLSDDLTEMQINVTSDVEEPIFSSTVTEVGVDVSSRKDSVASNSNERIMDNIAPEITTQRAPTPDIEITTVPDLPRSDDEEEVEPPKETSDTEKNGSDNSPPTDSNVTTQALPGSPPEDNTQINETEQMDTGLDFAQPSGANSANPFASPEEEETTYQPAVTSVFSVTDSVTEEVANNFTSISYTQQTVITNVFAPRAPPPVAPRPAPTNNIFAESDEFDAFSVKFDSVKKEGADAFGNGFGSVSPIPPADAWGDSDVGKSGGFDDDTGFGDEDDGFTSMQAPPPLYPRRGSGDSGDKDFSVVIKPHANISHGPAPAIAPPPARVPYDSRINPFDKGDETAEETQAPLPDFSKRTDSQETPPTPLFDDDVSQPLEDFPRINYAGPGWEMQLRQPNKKKITGQRFWKKIYVRLLFQGDVPVVQLLNQATDKTPFQELPLQPSYSVSEIAGQQYDQFGKIFTLKLQYIFYKERAGIRPGQVTKAERITNKLSQFAKYAIDGDYAGVKEFGSDLKKLGLPVEHAPQTTQLFKVGSMSYEDMKQFSICIEEALFKLTAHRDRALTYKMEEVQVTAVDEIYVEQDADGHVSKQIARVRLFFLAFLTGMPTIELGVNDMWRQGKEVVGRHDIIPVATEEWIRLEGVEFHTIVQQDEYERSRIIKFQPPDAMYIELMRFRVRPPKNRELPFQLKASWCVTGNRVELKADILVPGFASRKLGQIPCEDVSVRFPIPECWIYLFRVEKHFRYGSVKSAHRRTGKIKGIERILGAVDTLQESLIEVTSGQAKYEHQHRAIVWRCSRLPKEGQGAYTTHQLVCRMALTSYDQIPETLAPYAFVEFTMPATQVSHTTVRSVSVQDSDSDDPPEKYVKYLARHEYRVGIETTRGETQNAYLVATKVIKEEPAPKPAAVAPTGPSDSDSDSN